MTATRVTDANGSANTYVWKLAASKPVAWLRFAIKLSVGACYQGSVFDGVEGSFWPYGRSVYNCYFGYRKPSPLAIKANRAKCVANKGELGGPHNKVIKQPSMSPVKPLEPKKARFPRDG